MKRYALVICGGGSTRMGVDKALLTFDDKPMILHHVHAFLEEGWVVVVAGVDEARAALLEESDVSMISVNEEKGQRGPIRGILAGLEATPDDAWVQLSPCDAPHLINTILDIKDERNSESMWMPVWFKEGERFPEPLWACGPKKVMRRAVLEHTGPLHMRFMNVGCMEQLITLPQPEISSLNTMNELKDVTEKMVMDGDGC